MDALCWGSRMYTNLGRTNHEKRVCVILNRILDRKLGLNFLSFLYCSRGETTTQIQNLNKLCVLKCIE